MKIDPNLSFNDHKAILLQKAIDGEIDFKTYFNEVSELEEHFFQPPDLIEILEDLVSRTQENGYTTDEYSGYSNALIGG